MFAEKNAMFKICKDKPKNINMLTKITCIYSFLGPVSILSMNK